ncbi:MAG: ORF6N domain-containing protein, partial [Pedobacter sp.]
METKIKISDELVMNQIYIIRGHKVMLDSDLAELYGAETKQLKRQVKRNAERFPEDFMFELNTEEQKVLR